MSRTQWCPGLWCRDAQDGPSKLQQGDDSSYVASGGGAQHLGQLSMHIIVRTEFLTFLKSNVVGKEEGDSLPKLCSCSQTDSSRTQGVVMLSLSA